MTVTVLITVIPAPTKKPHVTLPTKPHLRYLTLHSPLCPNMTITAQAVTIPLSPHSQSPHTPVILSTTSVLSLPRSNPITITTMQNERRFEHSLCSYILIIFSLYHNSHHHYPNLSSPNFPVWSLHLTVSCILSHLHLPSTSVTHQHTIYSIHYKSICNTRLSQFIPSTSLKSHFQHITWIIITHSKITPTWPKSCTHGHLFQPSTSWLVHRNVCVFVHLFIPNVFTGNIGTFC